MEERKPNLFQRYCSRKLRRIQAEAGVAPPCAWTDFNFMLSFGITLAVMLFLSVRVGAWLGRVLDCGSWATILLGLLSIAGTIRVMVKEVLTRDKPPAEDLT